MQYGYRKAAVVAATLLMSSASFAGGLDGLAPTSVSGMTMYGNIKVQKKYNANIVLNFRAPMKKNGTVSFYPVSGPNKNVAKNSGVYKYTKIGTNYGILIYRADKGLSGKVLFRMMLTFNRKMTGIAHIKLYHFKTKNMSLDTPPSKLNYVKSQTAMFQFRSS